MLRKQENVSKVFLIPGIKILLLKHMLPSLATMKALLTSVYVCVNFPKCCRNIVSSFSYSGKTFSFFSANFPSQETRNNVSATTLPSLARP